MTHNTETAYPGWSTMIVDSRHPRTVHLWIAALVTLLLVAGGVTGTYLLMRSRTGSQACVTAVEQARQNMVGMVGAYQLMYDAYQAQFTGDQEVASANQSLAENALGNINTSSWRDVANECTGENW